MDIFNYQKASVAFYSTVYWLFFSPLPFFIRLESVSFHFPDYVSEFGTRKYLRLFTTNHISVQAKQGTFNVLVRRSLNGIDELFSSCSDAHLK